MTLNLKRRSRRRRGPGAKLETDRPSGPHGGLLDEGCCKDDDGNDDEKEELFAKMHSFRRSEGPRALYVGGENTLLGAKNSGFIIEN